MAATTTEPKSKKPKSIVTTRVTSDGVKNELAKSSQDQLDRTYELIHLLCNVPAWAEKANAALETLGELADATRAKP